ncbi:MAG: hypothetical protein AAGG81_04970 [Chlamydiota bacterium]
MNINPKVFYYPPPFKGIIRELDTEKCTDYCFKPMIGEDESFSEELIEEDVEELDENGLATTVGWPGESSNEDDYWEKVNTYPGGTLERSSLYVHNLLNDRKLNTASKSLTLNTKYKKNLPLLNQTMLDLRRLGRVTINGQIVYDMSKIDDNVEIFINNWTDDEKTIYTFKECMNALHKSFPLTSNALKLSTQATLAPLTRLIIPRFSNLQLSPPNLIHCCAQSVNIETREKNITRIFYHSIWSIVSMDDHETPLKYMKGSVEFVFGTDDLINGRAGSAREFERCTPFFDTFDEAVECGEWPANAKSTEIYDKRIGLFPDYKEHLHPLIAASCLKHLAKTDETSTAECIEKAVQSKFLPLKNIILFDRELYNENDLLSKLPDQGEFICETINKNIHYPSLIIGKLMKFSCLGIGNLLTKIAYSKFLKPSIDRHVSCYQYQLTIKHPDNDKSHYQIIATSKWYTHDMSKENTPILSRFEISLIATISESELTSTSPTNIDLQLEVETF